MNEYLHYLNGIFVSEDKLLVSPRDLGFSRNFAVFDYLRTYNGIPFKLQEHLYRLLKSAELINLNHSYSLEFLTKLVQLTLDQNNDGNEKTLRIILSGGVSNFMYQSTEATIMIIVDVLNLRKIEIYETGIKVKLVKFIRYMPEVKSTNYIEGVKQSQLGRQNDSYEQVYYSTKQIYEGATSNIFCTKNGKIFTPKNNILFGVTRGVLINDLKNKLDVIEKDYKLSFLLSADEVFVTSSGKEIMPVVKADENIIGDGKVGKITKFVMKEFKEFALHSHEILN